VRRNVDVKIVMFNNRIYGLTKGQYSPMAAEHYHYGWPAEELLRQPGTPVTLQPSGLASPSR
jgi:hypothetical protein